MYRIKKYNEFSNNCNKLSEYYKTNMTLLYNIDISKSNEIVMSKIVESLYKKLNINERNKVDIFLNNCNSELCDVINESFWDKLTKRIDKASEVSNVLPDESEGILKKLIRKAGQAVDFISKILQSIKDWIANMIKDVISKVTERIKGDGKFSESVKKVLKEEENEFIKDLKIAGSVYEFYKTDLLNTLVGSMKKSITNFLSNEQNPIPENFEYITNEGKNVLSTWVHGIEKIPPFSWLEKVATIGEKGANKVIEGLSLLTNKLGGPKFTLPTIAVLIGIVFEYNIKSTVKHGILSIFGDAFTGGLLHVISWIATFIAAVVMIDQISGVNILGIKH